ncbi:MAG: hypothetical protein VKL39_24865, partial [Leptolyngbyaceae bacterium]|nr:hypothetical protein [Leptolyngbyaceae bacterium]
MRRNSRGRDEAAGWADDDDRFVGGAMSASQRRKGAAAEREVSAILTDALGVAVKRKLGQS